jgi:hypothetical protein
VADRILLAVNLGADVGLVETAEFLVEADGEVVGRIAQIDAVLRAFRAGDEGSTEARSSSTACR